MKRLGIYSGSFDPVHAGHMAFAAEAMRICKLETVVFMPEAVPRKKPHVSPISERLVELEIALASLPFRVLDTYSDRFTVDETLTELKTRYPGADFTFLVGSDVALGLPQWPGIDRITTTYRFAVGMRSGDNDRHVKQVLDELGANYHIIRTSHGHVSSRALKAKEPSS